MITAQISKDIPAKDDVSEQNASNLLNTEQPKNDITAKDDVSVQDASDWLTTAPLTNDITAKDDPSRLITAEISRDIPEKSASDWLNAAQPKRDTSKKAYVSEQDVVPYLADNEYWPSNSDLINSPSQLLARIKPRDGPSTELDGSSMEEAGEKSWIQSWSESYTDSSAEEFRGRATRGEGTETSVDDTDESTRINEIRMKMSRSSFRNDLATRVAFEKRLEAEREAEVSIDTDTDTEESFEDPYEHIVNANDRHFTENATHMRLKRKNRSWAEESLSDTAAEEAFEAMQARIARSKIPRSETDESRLTPNRRMRSVDFVFEYYDPVNAVAEERVASRRRQDSLGVPREVHAWGLEDEELSASKFAKLAQNYAASRQILFFFNAVPPPSELLVAPDSLTLPKGTIEEMTDATDHIQLLGRLKLLRNLSLLNYERALMASYHQASLGSSEAERYTDLRAALKAVKANLYMLNRLRVKLGWKGEDDFARAAWDNFFTNVCDEFDDPTATDVVLLNEVSLSVVMERCFHNVQHLVKRWDYLYNGREQSKVDRSRWTLRKRKEFLLFAQVKDAIAETLDVVDLTPDEYLLLLYCLTKIDIFMEDIMEEEKILTSRGDIDFSTGMTDEDVKLVETIVPEKQNDYDVFDSISLRQKFQCPFFGQPLDSLIDEMVPINFAAMLLGRTTKIDVLDAESCSVSPYLIGHHRELLATNPEASEHIFVANFVNRLLLGIHFLALVDSELHGETSNIASFHFGRKKCAFMDEDSKPIMYAKVGLVKVYWNPNRDKYDFMVTSKHILLTVFSASYELLAKASSDDRKAITLGDIMEGFAGLGLFLHEDIKRRVVSAGDIRKGIKRWDEIHHELLGSIWIQMNPKVMSSAPIVGNAFLMRLREERNRELAGSKAMEEAATVHPNPDAFVKEWRDRVMREAQSRAMSVKEGQSKAQAEAVPAEPSKRPLPVYRRRPKRPSTNNPALKRMLDKIHSSAWKRGREMFLEAISAEGDGSEDEGGAGIGDSFKLDL